MTPSVWHRVRVVLMSVLGACCIGLGPAARQQIHTFRDGGHFDQAGLYPLLREASGGIPVEGAVVVGAAGLAERPAAFRGRLVHLDARSAGRARTLPLLREGGWPNPITEWGLQLGVEGEHPAVVLLAADPGRRPPPAGTPLRGTAWFLGHWGDVDASGTQRRYPVLVSHPDAIRGVEQLPGRGTPLAAMLTLLLALGAGTVVLRRLTRRTSRGSSHRIGADPEGFSGLEADVELPADPAEAMRVMAAAADPVRPGRGNSDAQAGTLDP